MKKIILISLLFCCYQAFSQTPVDGLMNLNLVSPQSPATVLTQTILANGTAGTTGWPANGWGTPTGTAANLTVDVFKPECALMTTVSNGGQLYTPYLPAQSFRLNTNSNFTYFNASITGSKSKVSTGGCIIFGPPPGPNHVWDVIRLDDFGGHFVIMQFVDGTGGSYGVRLHSDGNGSIVSSMIPLQQNVAYRWTMLGDETTGTAKLQVRLNVPPYSIVGSPQTLQQQTGRTYSGYRIGNAEIGTANASIWFQNTMIDTTNATYPLAEPDLDTPWAGLVSPVRMTDWRPAGATIDPRTTICATLNSTTTTAAAQTAINNCPVGQTVFFSAGTYSNMTTLPIGKSGVTVRGAGDSTIWAPTNTSSCSAVAVGYCPANTDNNRNLSPSNLANWTSGYLAGSKTITLSSVTNLKVGNPIILDQLDDVCDSGGVVVNSDTTTGQCPSPPLTGVASPYSLEGNNGNAQRSGRNQLEIQTVAGCDGNTTPGHQCVSTTVTISPGLTYFNWRASQTPQAWWATSPGLAAGLENIKIDCIGIGTNSQAPCVMFKNHAGSWMSGVVIKDSSRAGVQMYLSTQLTVVSNYFWHTFNGVTTSYGAECFTCSHSLIANNIFQAIAGPMLKNGATAGNVWFGNSAFNDYYIKNAGWNQPANSAHSAGNLCDLDEENISNIQDNDVFHGTHHCQTIFRGFQYGKQLACYAGPDAPSPAPPYPGTVPFGPCNNNLPPSRFSSFSRGANIFNSVFGQTGAGYTTYQSQNTANSSIFNIGAGNSEGSVTVQNDNNVLTTMMRWGNFDVVTSGIRNNCSEVPSGLTNTAQEFFNSACPTGFTFPASFYYSSRPSFWPASIPWPAIGGDITGGNLTTYPGVQGHVNMTPSYNCAVNIMGIPADGTGDIKAFSADTCYNGSGPLPPSAPTNLQVVVH